MRIQEERATIWILEANVHFPGCTKNSRMCITRQIHCTQIFATSNNGAMVWVKATPGHPNATGTNAILLSMEIKV
jgi:hypothetical protein